MSRTLDRDAHAALTAALRQRPGVAGCLPYEGMTPVPPAFERWVRHHFASLRGIAWRDACPAYALGYLTHHGYDLAEDEDALHALWDELFASDLDWESTRRIVEEAWHWLRATAPAD